MTEQRIASHNKKENTSRMQCKVVKDGRTIDINADKIGNTTQSEGQELKVDTQVCNAPNSRGGEEGALQIQAAVHCEIRTTADDSAASSEIDEK